MTLFKKKKATILGVLFSTFLACMAGFAAAQSDFTPRWAAIIDNFDLYFELSPAEITDVYQEVERLNALYDGSGEGAFDIAFFPDIRAKQFYEITPYNDEDGQPIADDNTVAKAIMEVRYVLNANSVIGVAEDGPINLALNMLPRQDTNVVFARVAFDRFNRKISFLCMIGYDPRLDSKWQQRKAFFDEAEAFAAEAGFFQDVPEKAWQNFSHHLRAAMCSHLQIATWLTEPPSLAFDIDKANRKNKAFSYIMAYAGLMAARDGYPAIMPKLLQMFEQIEEAGTPVFGMKVLVVDMSSEEGKVRIESDVAVPFSPFIILKEASKLDYMQLEPRDELANAVFAIVEKAKFDGDYLANRWLTEEFESYRMGF